MNRNKLVTYALVVAASFLTLVGFSSSRAYSQGNGAATLQNQPFSFEVNPACNNDDVIVTGKYSIEEQEFTAGDGSIHLHVNISAHGTATGSPSGENYVFSYSQSEVGNVDSTNSTGEVSYTDPYSFRLISKAGGPNLYVTMFIHITVDANGNVTASITRVEVNCHG
jgi:hypothetical protein